MIKQILKLIGRFIAVLFSGTVVSLTASGILDIHYFFIRLKNTSGLPSLQQWLIAGLVIGLIIGIAKSLQILKRSKQPKDIKVIILLVLRLLITTSLVTGVFLATWNYYVFDYFRLKDAGPVALTVGLILALWDLSKTMTNNMVTEKS